jgi:ferredoxin/flavodoxin
MEDFHYKKQKIINIFIKKNQIFSHFLILKNFYFRISTKNNDKHNIFFYFNKNLTIDIGERKMKKTMIHYFTGTGNTEHAAKVLKTELEKLEHEVTLLKIKSGSVFKNENYDLHIFMYPVYAFTIPYGFEKYLKKLPKLNGAKAVVIANHGMVNMKGGINTGYEGPGTLIAKNILERKKLDVFLTTAAGYPENITILADRINEKDAGEIFEAADSKIKNIALKINNEERSIKKYNLIVKIFGYMFGVLFTYFGKWHLGKTFIANKNCNSCGICAASCPEMAVRMFNKKPVWNYNCNVCLCCYNVCPENAIQISLLRIIIITVLSVVLLFLEIFNFNFIIKNTIGLINSELIPLFLNNVFVAGLSGVIIFIIFYPVAFYLIEKIIFLLEQIPFIRLLFELTFTKEFKRYIAPGFKPYKK